MDVDGHRKFLGGLVSCARVCMCGPVPVNEWVVFGSTSEEGSTSIFYEVKKHHVANNSDVEQFVCSPQVQVFQEVCRVLKPGCMFGGYEWVVTDKYESHNEAHVTLKEGIEVGNGLPTLATPAIIKANLEEAGFEVRSRVACELYPCVGPIAPMSIYFVVDRHKEPLCTTSLINWDLRNLRQVVCCLKNVFCQPVTLSTHLQVVYAYDANETTHSESEIPWYQPLCGSFWSISGFRQTHLGRVCTHGLVCTMELLRIAPKGSAQVSGVF